MTKSRFKRSKMGKLPGELPICLKAILLEGRTPQSKSFRKDHQYRANRRFRHNALAEIKQLSES